MTPRADPWQDYRRCRRLLRWAFLAGLACCAGGFLVARAQHAVRPLYVGLGIFVCVVAWASLPLAEFPCPNCGEPFVHRGRHRNLFTRKCMNCQHPRGS